MKNYLQPGDTITIPAPASFASGDVVIIGGLVGIAAGDAAAAAPLDVVTRGIFSLPKAAAADFTLGATVYFDATNKVATATATGNARIGLAVAAAAANTAAVEVRLG